MGDIMIHVPQHIHVEYTIENDLLTKQVLDLLNAMMLHTERKELPHDNLLGLFADQPELLDEITESAMHARETAALRVS